MNSVVIYDSHFGNTKMVAEAIAAQLRSRGTVQLYSAEDAPSSLPAEMDLLVIGGPTEGFRMTPPVSRFLSRVDRSTLEGVRAAVFDTRIRPRWWLLGYAGPGIAKRLRGLGAQLIDDPEPFFVEGEINEASGAQPHLEKGEIERATAWAAELAEAVERPRVPV
jgi:flavodoxin